MKASFDESEKALCRPSFLRVWETAGFDRVDAMAPSAFPGLSGRYLSFAEREEIAMLHAKRKGVRAIARPLGRSPSTVSRELRRKCSDSRRLSRGPCHGRRSWLVSVVLAAVVDLVDKRRGTRAVAARTRTRFARESRIGPRPHQDPWPTDTLDGIMRSRSTRVGPFPASTSSQSG